MVILVAALLVAVTIYPAFATLQAATDSFSARLDEAAAGLHRIRYPQSSTIYAEDGTQYTTIDAGENRVLVSLDKVSDTAQESVVAIEDYQFFIHGGIDPEAIIRAGIANLASGTVEQGGSTITQQLIKQAIIGSSEQTFDRKFQEAAMAMQMEREYDKPEILHEYLNEIYFANGVYGIETAAEFYFNRPASKLNLAQSALLAGMIAAPETYDPLHHPDKAKARRNIVLDRMASDQVQSTLAESISQYGAPWENVPTPRQIRKAKKSPLNLRVKREKHKTQPFEVSYITSQLFDTRNHEFDDVLGTTEEERQRSLGSGGFKVYTTLNPDWTRVAQQAASNSLGQAGAVQAAIATVEVKNGAIRVLMSGQNYDHDQRNLVVPVEVGGTWQGVRQPGSSFKPFTLVAAFEEGITPDKTYDSSSPVHIPEWDNDCHCVENAEGEGAGGPMNLWDATKYSVNVVFAQLVMDVGPENVVKVASKMGITTPMLDVPSITLGSEETAPLDMASAYSTFAGQGTHCEPYVISKIVKLSEGHDKTVYKHKDACKEVIEPDIANLVTQMLTGVVQGGTGTAAALGDRPVAGKTGTSQDSADLWFVGYTPDYSTAVWVGHPKGRVPMDGYGGTVAAPIWHTYMQRILSGVKASDFQKPDKHAIKEKGSRIPDVVGMDVAEATTALEDKSFHVDVRDVQDESHRGTVLGQSPNAGTKGTVGDTVTLTVSNGKPPSLTVPNVVGQQEHQATVALQDLGFAVHTIDRIVSDASQNRIVLHQSPRDGTDAQRGDTITITVGNAH